jgi:hypothetical protein
MNMGASVVAYTVDAEHAEELAKRVRGHLVPAAQGLNGYRGFLLLDQGDGNRLSMLQFDLIANVQAAQQALTPAGRAAAERAKLVHDRAVRRYVYDVLTPDQLAALGEPTHRRRLVERSNPKVDSLHNPDSTQWSTTAEVDHCSHNVRDIAS